MRLLLEALHRHAAATPDATAVVDGSGRMWTWSEVLATHRRIALAIERAATPCPTIVVRVPPGGAFWGAVLGVTAAGRNALLLPHDAPPAEMQRALQVEGGASEFNPAWLDSPGVGMHGAPPHDAPSRHALPTGGLVLLSSGTTGRSRYVLRSPDSVDRIAEGLVQADLYRAGDVVASVLPMSHAFGLEHAFLAPLLAGACVRQFDAFGDAFGEEVARCRATVLPVVPAAALALARQSHAGTCLRLAITAGSPLSPQARAEWHDAMKVELVDLYGATEVGTIWLDRGGGGVPMPSVEVQVIRTDEPGRVLACKPGEAGEIAVRTPTAASRIVAPVPGEPLLQDGWFRTGDLGVSCGAHRWRIVGRCKLIFDVAGRKVNPYEVEAAIDSHASVAASLVEPVEVGEGLHRVAAKVEVRAGVQPPSANDLRRHLSALLPTHAIPRSIEFVPRLPRTRSGKVLRAAAAQRTVDPQPVSPVQVRPAGMAQRSDRERWTRSLFDNSAAGYDASSGSPFLGAGRWYRARMLRATGLRPGSALLDVGAGTGLCSWLAQRIVGPTGRVLAVDPSPGMLEQARRRGVRETMQGSAERLPVGDACFDMVVMSYMLRHVDDLAMAFAEARRVLRPGGRILILEVTSPTQPLARGVFHAAMINAVPALGVLTSGRPSTFPMMRYWGETIRDAAPPQAVVAALSGAGFVGARHTRELGVFSSFRGIVPM